MQWLKDWFVRRVTNSEPVTQPIIIDSRVAVSTNHDPVQSVLEGQIIERLGRYKAYSVFNSAKQIYNPKEDISNYKLALMRVLDVLDWAIITVTDYDLNVLLKAAINTGITDVTKVIR